jgi:Domain of unknown function (DUF4180)
MNEERKILIASDSGVSVRSFEDISDVIAAGIDAEGVIFTEDDLAKEFFDLRTGLAGEFFQKCMNYGVRLAIVLPDTKAYGERISELAYEHRSHSMIRFVYSINEAKAWLSGSPIHHMTVVRYYDDRPWDSEQVLSPLWSDVETAIRRMDNYYFPIVQLNCVEDEEDEDENVFNIIGGAGRFALFHAIGDWQYEDPTGEDERVRLWESDQGYFCKERNVLTDIEKVLRITRAYYETGSYEGLDDVR